jgi:hypothetical protein
MPRPAKFDVSQATAVGESQILEGFAHSASALSTVEKITKGPGPDYLRNDFNDLLRVKQRSILQVVIGPVLTKDDGADGFPTLANLGPITEEAVVKILQSVSVSSNFVITISNAEKRLAKIRFEGLRARDNRDRLLSSWKMLREKHSVWASPDQPMDLSKMEINAKRFGIALRKSKDELKQAYVEVRNGVLYIAQTKIAPVYMIPETDKWPLVNSVVLEALLDNRGFPWTSRKIRRSPDDIAKKIWDTVWSAQDGDSMEC